MTKNNSSSFQNNLAELVNSSSNKIETAQKWLEENIRKNDSSSNQEKIKELLLLFDEDQDKTNLALKWLNLANPNFDDLVFICNFIQNKKIKTDISKQWASIQNKNIFEKPDLSQLKQFITNNLGQNDNYNDNNNKIIFISAIVNEWTNKFFEKTNANEISFEQLKQIFNDNLQENNQGNNKLNQSLKSYILTEWFDKRTSKEDSKIRDLVETTKYCDEIKSDNAISKLSLTWAKKYLSLNDVQTSGQLENFFSQLKSAFEESSKSYSNLLYRIRKDIISYWLSNKNEFSAEDIKYGLKELKYSLDTNDTNLRNNLIEKYIDKIIPAADRTKEGFKNYLNSLVNDKINLSYFLLDKLIKNYGLTLDEITILSRCEDQDSLRKLVSSLLERNSINSVEDFKKFLDEKFPKTEDYINLKFETTIQWLQQQGRNINDFCSLIDLWKTDSNRIKELHKLPYVKKKLFSFYAENIVNNNSIQDAKNFAENFKHKNLTKTDIRNFQQAVNDCISHNFRQKQQDPQVLINLYKNYNYEVISQENSRNSNQDRNTISQTIYNFVRSSQISLTKLVDLVDKEFMDKKFAEFFIKEAAICAFGNYANKCNIEDFKALFKSISKNNSEDKSSLASLYFVNIISNKEKELKFPDYLNEQLSLINQNFDGNSDDSDLLKFELAKNWLQYVTFSNSLNENKKINETIEQLKFIFSFIGNSELKKELAELYSKKLFTDNNKSLKDLCEGINQIDKNEKELNEILKPQLIKVNFEKITKIEELSYITSGAS